MIFLHHSWLFQKKRGKIFQVAWMGLQGNPCGLPKKGGATKGGCEQSGGRGSRRDCRNDHYPSRRFAS